MLHIVLLHPFVSLICAFLSLLSPCILYDTKCSFVMASISLHFFCLLYHNFMHVSFWHPFFLIFPYLLFLFIFLCYPAFFFLFFLLLPPFFRLLAFLFRLFRSHPLFFIFSSNFYLYVPFPEPLPFRPRNHLAQPRYLYAFVASDISL